MEKSELIYEKLIERVKPYFEGIQRCHDFSHTERVMNMALHIGKKEKADLEILKLAALLHDICRKEEFDSKGKICHAEKGAQIARKILQQFNVEDDKIDDVIHVIESHRFRRGKSPESKEAKVFSDADNLDAIGAIGVARAFSFSGHIGSKIHNPDIILEKTRTYTEDDTAYREFLIKLSKIKDRMLTKEGKTIAKERHEYMKNFFNRLNEEWKGDL